MDTSLVDQKERVFCQRRPYLTTTWISEDGEPIDKKFQFLDGYWYLVVAAQSYLLYYLVNFKICT